MRRTIKYIPILMSILVSVFMFSVGFSSWLVINPTVSGDQGGSFSAYEVNEYIVWHKTDMFKYTSLYFVDESNTSYKIKDEDGNPVKNVGKITVTYSLTETAKALAANGGLKVTFRLGYTDANGTPKLFTTTNTQAFVKGKDEPYKPEADTVEFAFTHTFSGSSLPDTFTVTYVFTTTVGSGFRNEFGKYLLNNKNGVTTKFVTSAEAEVSGQ